MNKLTVFIAFSVLALTPCAVSAQPAGFPMGNPMLLSATPARSGCTVNFDTGGGSAIAPVILEPGSLIPEPAHPVKDGWVFTGWYSDPTASIRMWDFRNTRISTPVTLYAGWVKVDSKHLLLNAYASETELRSPYVAATLQTLGKLSADRHTLTLPDGATVYIAPGVYWTDETYAKGFPFDDSGFVIAAPNVGLSVIGDGVSFIGLTSDAEDVRICGNRGEGGARGLGAGGSWYSLAVSNGFRAENITIANYAQEDLVYSRDPSQNISKRIDSKNHAEVLRSAGRVMDKVCFRNVRFVGYLNMMAGFAPRRSYFKDCFIQCTDDSIFQGGVNVYENCTFHCFGNHPTWAGADAGGINALLGCSFVGMPQLPQPMLSFAKNCSGRDGAGASGIYAVIDCNFSGRIKSVEWENKVHDYSRYAVSNNTIGEERQPLTISAAMPELSVEYSGDALKAFKVGDEYNIYNLLKGDDGWDPAGQHSAAWEPYSNLPYRFLVGQTGNVLYSDETGERNTIVLTPVPVPASSVDLSKAVWEYDESILDGVLTDPKTGVLTVSAKPNNTGKVIETLLECTLPGGVKAGVRVRIRPVTVQPPVLKKAAIRIAKGTAVLRYRTDKPAFRDVSKVDWYRVSDEAGNDAVHIGTMMNDEAGLFIDDPFKEYPLSKYDVGCYLRAVITPKYEFSPYAAETVTVCSPRPVSAKDVRESVLYTDFRNLNIESEPVSTKGRWFFDCAEPDRPWGWGIGTNGAEGLWGLMNGNRKPDASRMVFGQTGAYGDMSLTLHYSTGKAEGQGFGGSGCFMDVYVKYDPVTRCGWGLRIERVPATTNGTMWTLCRYDGGELTRLEGGVLAAAFMAGGTITLSVSGDRLSVVAFTETERTPLQVAENLPDRVELEWTDASSALSACTDGGFGLRMYNSGSPSYFSTAGTNNCVMLHDISVIAEER